MPGFETRFVDGELQLGMMWRSRKALDLMRDARCAVHSTTCDKDGSEGDFKVYGTAEHVLDPFAGSVQQPLAIIAHQRQASRPTAAGAAAAPCAASQPAQQADQPGPGIEIGMARIKAEVTAAAVAMRNQFAAFEVGNTLGQSVGRLPGLQQGGFAEQRLAAHVMHRGFTRRTIREQSHAFPSRVHGLNFRIGSRNQGP